MSAPRCDGCRFWTATSMKLVTQPDYVIGRCSQVWQDTYAKHSCHRFQARVVTPIDVVLFCPACKAQHIDAPEPETGWTNPPHKSHRCHSCGHIWRAADVPTNGVRQAQTRGEKDTAL